MLGYTVSYSYSIATMGVSLAVSEIFRVKKMAWPWNLGKGSFKVIGNGTVCWIARVPWRSIVTWPYIVSFPTLCNLAIQATETNIGIWFDLKGDICKKNITMTFSYLTCIKRPRKWWPRRNFAKKFSNMKTRIAVLSYAEESMIIFERFDTTPELCRRTDRQTDGRTDRQTDGRTDRQTDGQTEVLYQCRWRATKTDK